MDEQQALNQERQNIREQQNYSYGLQQAQGDQYNLGYGDELIRWQLNTGADEKLQNIYATLKGFVYDFKLKKYSETQIATVYSKEEDKYYQVEVPCKPLLNDDGVAFVMNTIFALFHKDMNLSNLNEKEINYITYTTFMTILDGLYCNWYDFGNPDEVTMSKVAHEIEINLYVIIKRAFGDKERGWLRTIEKVSSVNSTPVIPQQQQKKRWWVF